MSAFPAVRTETGTLPGGMPYAKTGSGPRTLVVLPGFGDAMFGGEYPPFTGWLLAPYFARYLEEYAVVLLSRPRGLPAGYDADDAVETHARAFEALADSRSSDGSSPSADSTSGPDFDSPDGSSSSIDVIGISMGGLIGQELARRRPDLVDRLVLTNSACRLAEAARPAVRHLERLAREHDWFSIRSELARALYADVRALTYPPLIQTVGRFTLPRPAEPADVWRSLEFILGFDGCGRLGEIDHPTLVFGGERDPYFTADAARETAEGLPNAELTLVPGAKHGAFHERKSTFDSRVLRFLAERTQG